MLCASRERIVVHCCSNDMGQAKNTESLTDALQFTDTWSHFVEKCLSETHQKVGITFQQIGISL